MGRMLSSSVKIIHQAKLCNTGPLSLLLILSLRPQEYLDLAAPLIQYSEVDVSALVPSSNAT